MESPNPGGPDAPARRVASDWDYVGSQGYAGGTEPIFARVMQAQRIWRPEAEQDEEWEQLWDAYWDTMLARLKEAQVLMFKTEFTTSEHDTLTSLYVVDRTRFTVFTDVRGHVDEETGMAVIHESDAQKFYTAP